MASRAKKRVDGADRLTSAGLHASSQPFPVAIRIVILSALLLLAVYTVLAVLRLTHAAADAAGPEPRMQAEVLASRADAQLGRLRTAVLAAAQILQHPPGEPLDSAEDAFRLAHPFARGAVVLSKGEVLAGAGQRNGGAWKKAAEAAQASGAAVWTGRIDDSVYVVATARTVRGRVEVIAAADPAGLIDADAGPGPEVVASSDGKVLASTGVSPDAATLHEALGIDPPDFGQQSDARVRQLGRVAVAQSLDGTVVGAVAPSAAGLISPRSGIAGDVYALFAPLVIVCGLTLMLMRQTRKAEAAQKARSEAERKFRLAVEAAHCGIWEWRLGDNTVFMSDVTGAMLGWGGGGIALAEDVIARIAPEHRERVRQALRAATSFGAFDVSFCVPKANGAAAWIDMRGQGFGEPRAGGFTTIIGVALDVTEERTAESRAQAAERRLHDAIDSVSEAFVLWDRFGRLMMCNQNYRDFFSLEPRLLKPGASRDMVQQIADLAVRRYRPAPDGRRGVQEVELADGRWLQISERRTADGGLVMTASDITALKRQEEARRLNEEALQNAVARLEENSRELAELAEKYQAEKIRAESANSAKSEFLANMSHELRTPLNAINGFSEMMVSEIYGPLGDKRYKEYVQDILASGQHLLAVINDILDMSKIEAGKLNLRFEPVNLEDVAEDTVRLMRNRAETAKLTVSVDIPSDLPEVEADYRALKQVLFNLLSNALKFTPQGGRVQVHAKATRDEAGGEQVKVSVIDTGIGISAEDLARIARPFEQIESQHSKTQQGTGLGLALTKSLVELHDGRFELESEPGVGTTASFTLPVQRVESGGRPASARSSAAA